MQVERRGCPYEHNNVSMAKVGEAAQGTRGNGLFGHAVALNRSVALHRWVEERTPFFPFVEDGMHFPYNLVTGIDYHETAIVALPFS